MKTVAYLRVSTAQQDVRCQRLAILEYARIQGFPIDNFIEATASGQASEKRRRLDELMSVLQRGDRLVVSELSRLGRSLGQIVAILDALATAGVAFVAIKENIRVEGTLAFNRCIGATLQTPACLVHLVEHMKAMGADPILTMEISNLPEIVRVYTTLCR